MQCFVYVKEWSYDGQHILVKSKLTLLFIEPLVSWWNNSYKWETHIKLHNNGLLDSNDYKSFIIAPTTEHALLNHSFDNSLGALPFCVWSVTDAGNLWALTFELEMEFGFGGYGNSVGLDGGGGNLDPLVWRNCRLFRQSALLVEAIIHGVNSIAFFWATNFCTCNLLSVFWGFITLLSNLHRFFPLKPPLTYTSLGCIFTAVLILKKLV